MWCIRLSKSRLQVAESAEEASVTLEAASKKYGAQAGAMLSTYTDGQDVASYDRAYQIAYDMGKSGIALSYAMNSEATAYLSEIQRELAYEAGQAAADHAALERDTQNKNAANGNTGRRKGVVKSEGVTIDDLKKNFNDSQGSAYRILSTIAETTGIDIVLYRSNSDSNGQFVDAQGKFKRSNNTIYIDVNAGISSAKDVNEVAKYTMLRTFSHEFTHFLEKWNPIRYNEFRKAVFDTLARALGIDIYVFESLVNEKGERVGANGWYDPSDGSIHLDLHAGISGGGTTLFTAAHELVHYIRDRSPEKFGVLADFLMERYGEQGVPVRDLIVNQIDKAKRNDRTISFDTAYEEVIADSMESMLSDGKVIERIAELKAKDKTLFERMREYFRSLARRVREAYKGLKPDSREGRYVAEMMRETERLQALFTDALVDASESGQKNNAREGVRYSERDDFQTDYETNVDAVLNGTYNSDNAIIIGRTPKTLTDIGLNQLPLTITANHIYSIAKTEVEAKAEGRYRKNTNYHGLGAEAVKQIGQKLGDPIMVLAHQEFTEAQRRDHAQSSKIIVAVELQIDGKQVICPIEVDANVPKDSKYYDVNLVSTYFDKSNFVELVKEAIAKENIGETGFYYLNNKKANTLLQDSGYQLPQHLASRLSASDTIIRHVSENVNRNISHFTESQQFKRWFGDWQNRPDKASKVVNEDGTPKVVYHQTGADFSVFNTNNPVAGANDSETPNGIFFKDNDHDIGLQGKKQMAVYLNARNILHFANREEANRWYRKHIDGYAKISEEYEQAMRAFDPRFKEIEQEQFDPATTDERYEELERMEDSLIEELREVEDGYRKQLRSLLDTFFIGGKSGFDCIELDYDGHRWINGKRENVHTYIVFDKHQIKSATDNIGAFDGTNPDIRYSDRDREALEEQREVNRLLQAQNEVLREDNRRLIEAVNIRNTVANGTRFTEGSVSAAAGKLMQIANARGDRSKLIELLHGYYEFIARGQEVSPEAMRERSEPIVDWLMEHRRTQNEVQYLYFASLFETIKHCKYLSGVCTWYLDYATLYPLIASMVDEYFGKEIT